VRPCTKSYDPDGRPGITVRAKTLIALAATLVLLVGALVMTSRSVLLSGFESLEQQVVRADVRRAESAIETEVDRLEALCRDWAESEDTYAYVERGQFGDAPALLKDASYGGHRLNFVVLLDADNHPVYGTGFDLGSGSQVPLPRSLSSNTLTRELPVLEHEHAIAGDSGIALLPESPALIAVWPVVSQTDPEEKAGLLLIGHFLDSTELSRLASATEVYRLTALRYETAALVEDYARAQTFIGDSGLSYVEPAGKEFVAGYSVIHDMCDQPAVVLKVEEPRKIYAEGVASTRYFTIFLLAAAVVIFIIVMLLMERFVLSRLTRLGTVVSGIGWSGESLERVSLPGRDELSAFADTLNKTLARLRDSQTALRDTEQRLRDVLENSVDVIYSMNRAGLQMGQLDYVSPACLAVLGYTADEFTSMGLTGLLERVHSDDRDSVLPSCSGMKCEQTGRCAFSLEYRFMHRDGRYRWIGDTRSVQCDARGTPIAVVGSLRDVTERKEVEAEIWRAKELFQKVYTSLRDAVFLLDTSNPPRIVDCNPAAVECFGYSHSDMVGQSTSFLHESRELQDTLRASAWPDLVRDGYVVMPECRMRRASGVLFFAQLTTVALRDEDGDWMGFVSVFSDLTERKQAEEQVLRSSKLASVGELASGVAHEVNNPLTGIMGYSQLLLERDDLPVDAATDIETINRESQRAARIVRNLLSFARQTDAAKTIFDVSEMARRTVELREYELRKKGITLTLDLADGLPSWEADYHQLQQVVLNLVANAEHAVARRGADGHVRVSTHLTDKGVALTVEDNGGGVPNDIEARIFDPFFTTKPVGQGTGLGLSICHGIVVAHGGLITLSNTSGEGATFTVVLPGSEAKPGIASDEVSLAVPSFSLPASSGRILVVDDDESVRHVVARRLARAGYTVEMAASGEEALELDCTSFDASVVDYRMSGMNGIELARRIEDECEGMRGRILIMTGDTSEATIRATLEKEGFPHLAKPFTVEALLQAVRQLTED